MYKDVCFLMGVNDETFEIMHKNLVNNKNVRRDDYPQTVKGAYDILIKMLSI